MFPPRSSLLGALLLGLSSPANAQSATTPRELRFSLGESGERPPAATVTVKEVVTAPKKRTLLSNTLLAKTNKTEPVLREVSVRFAELKLHVLFELPETLRSLQPAPRLQIQRLALFAPGEPVPRLMAEEALEQASGDWLLKRVLLADRPSAKECRLILRAGVEPKLALSKDRVLALNSLMASVQTPSKP